VGLVDDARTAVRRAEALAERGFGDAAIRYDLEQEGIAPEPVEEALAGLDPERERAGARGAARGRRPHRPLALRPGLRPRHGRGLSGRICERGLIGLGSGTRFTRHSSCTIGISELANRLRIDSSTVSRRRPTGT
jgi:hypothetical protein